MIWYLLYPLRGTTEPPQLAPSHPIRRAFQAHGTATARHWLLSILLTIAVAVPLCYPAIFQTDSPAATALRNLPKHVWTSTTEIESDKPPDVEVRQVWVHGDYMKAINPRVLQDALYIQDTLIGKGFGDDSKDVYNNHHMFARDDLGCVESAPGEKWGFHSPLVYWNCSKRLLEEDQTPLATINSRSNDQSVLNLTLRPSTVFAGKSFSNSKLVAADALVITLFDQTDSNVGDIWDARSRLLAEELSPEWSIFPQDGVVTHSRLYEFRFKSMTLNDDILLAASYLVTAAYVIWRMMQLRAIKSWFGLLITICVKMTVCIIASFTVCTFLGINLARIPRPWFPGVVFCFGLGNIFRLINVVLETPPEMPPQQRIGTALGEVGHLSLAVAVQNLALIYLCSHIVTPWVADFCVFAAVTLVFDFVFHLTFFLAVLSVDVQRMELSDSLERADLNPSKKVRQERLSWLAALQRGVLPFSTRFAGTVAIFSIILAINWHFFDSNGQQLSFHAVRDRIIARRRRRRDTGLWNPPPIYQARTPADWLRIQDHNTARELFGFIKPGAHSFVARIYDPLLVVLNGAKGRDKSETRTTLVDGLRRFAQQHAFPAALILVFLFAGVTLLMNYLLWTGLPESDDCEEDEEAAFSVRNLPTPQTLDIVRLVSSPRGHLVSISLDRTTSIWLYERGGYAQSSLHTAAMKPKLWPITASALDDSGTLLALCTDNGQVGLWSNAASRFTIIPKIELRGQVPVLFAFATIAGTENDKMCLVIVTPDGCLIEIETRTGIHNTERISSNPIVCATLYACAKGETCLVFVTKLGEVHILPLKELSNRTCEVVAGLDPGPPPGSNPSKIICIQGVPALGLIFALRDEEAEVFDFSSRALIHAFQIGHVRPHSFRVMHSARRLCLCGAPAVHSLSVAYTEQDTDHMIMQTFTLDENPTSQICLRKSSDSETHKCQGLDSATESVHIVEPAGVWESTSTLSVVGIRRCVQSPTPSSSTSGADNDYYTADPAALSSALKQRATRQSNPNHVFASLDLPFSSRQPPASPGDTDNWEAWTMTTTGEFRSRPLVADFTDETEQLLAKDDLFVAAPGPITRLGKRSVAVGFGNTVKIITLGKESFDGLDDGLPDVGLGSYKSRSRRGPGRKLQ